jgi:hypothetical protein
MKNIKPIAYVGTGGIITLFVVIAGLLLLQSCSIIQLDELEIQSYGHGEYEKGAGKGFLQTLGVLSDWDLIVDGESMCLNEECWSDVDAYYENCTASCDAEFGVPGDVEFSSGQKIYEFFEIIPAVYAIAPGGDIDWCYSDCEADYVVALMDSCTIPCENEVYEWNGNTITDIDGFYSHNYPRFYTMFEGLCENWLHSGEWMNTSEEMGCTDFRWFSSWACETDSIQSAGNVCEVIGKTWTCNETKMTCSE